MNLEIIDYSEKSIALLGNSKHLYDSLIKIGSYNRNLTVNGNKVAGWIFSKKRNQEVKEIVSCKEVSIVPKCKEVSITYSKDKLEQYLLNNINTLLSTLSNEFQIGSAVSGNDKKFLLLGGGCGFSWILIKDKRTKDAKLAEVIVADSKKVKAKIDKAVLNSIDKNYLNKLERAGNPIQAHQFQNLQYNSQYNGLIYKFMCEHLDVSKAKIYIENRLD